MATPALELSSGYALPQIALGLWQVTDSEIFGGMFRAAVAAGYRHFDSAQAYHNEHLLGEAVKQSGIARSEFFITTKIMAQNITYKRAHASFMQSLRKLNMEYVDLLLLHFPVPFFRVGAWKALEEIRSAGKAKSIGVSNFTVRHLEQLRRRTGIVPAVNQIELHVFLQQPKLVKYCQENGIIIEAYSPLAHAQANDDEVIKAIAQKHSKSYAQIMLRWCVQSGFIILPKSKTPARIAENIAIFDFALDGTDMQQLKARNRNLYTCKPTRPAYFMP